MKIKQHTLKQLMDQISYKENFREDLETSEKKIQHTKTYGYNKSNAESKVYSYKHVYLKDLKLTT